MLRATVIVLSLFLIGGLASCDALNFLQEEPKLTSEEINRFLIEKDFEVPHNAIIPRNVTYELTDGVKEPLDVNRGKITLINFWATWCPPCIHEMPSMNELHQTMKDRNFRILAVNLGDSPDTVQGFLNQHQYSFDVIVDPDRKVGSQFFVSGLPTTFIMGKEGEILGKIVGPLNWSNPDLVTFFKQLSNS